MTRLIETERPEDQKRRARPLKAKFEEAVRFVKRDGGLYMEARIVITKEMVERAAEKSKERR